MSDYKKYEEQQIRVYAKSKPINDWRKQMKNPRSNLELLKFVENFENNGRALDIGAGEGYHTQDLINMGYDAVGIELSPKRVADAQKLGRPYVIQGDAHNIPYKDETFNLIFMHEVLEHCAYPEKVIGEMFRVLKWDGKFVISLPLEGHWKKPQKDMTEHNLDAQDNHVWKPTVQMLAESLWTQFRSYSINLYTLDSIQFQFKWNPSLKINFRPHAFVVGEKVKLGK